LDFIFYNAGSEVLETDPLSSFLLRVEDMNERDVFVVDTALFRNTSNDYLAALLLPQSSPRRKPLEAAI